MLDCRLDEELEILEAEKHKKSFVQRFNTDGEFASKFLRTFEDTTGVEINLYTADELWFDDVIGDNDLPGSHTLPYTCGTILGHFRDTKTKFTLRWDETGFGSMSDE